MLCFKKVLISMVFSVIAVPLVLGQCSSVKKQSFLVSDRYKDGARHGDQLLLANTYGLVFRGVGQTEVPPIHIQPLPGTITKVVVSGEYVFAVAKGEGVHLLEYVPGKNLPNYVGFAAVQGVEAILLQGDTLFSRTSSELQLHHFDRGLFDTSDDPLEVLDAQSVVVDEMVADANFLYVRNRDKTVAAYHYAPLLQRAGPIVVNQNPYFYRIFMTDVGLVVDGLDGIYALNISPNGSVASRTNLSQGLRQVVLGSYGRGNHLYIFYRDQVDVYRLNATGKQLLGSVTQSPFSPLIPIVDAGDYFYQLNQVSQRRDWSLTSFQVGNSVSQITRQPALFEDLAAGVLFRDQIYLAANREVFLVKGEIKSDQLPEQELQATFNGNVLDMVASDTLLFVTAPIPNTGLTGVYVFGEAQGGGLTLLKELRVEGTVSQLSQFEDKLAFLRNVNSTTDSLFEASVLYRTSSGFQLRTDAIQVSHNSQNPFRELHISGLGLVYLRDGRVWVYDDPTDLSSVREQLFSRDFVIENIVADEQYFWIQAAELGLVLFKSEGAGAAVELGRYPHWFNLRRLPNHLIVAQNKLRPNPGSFHLLLLENNIVNDRVDFSTTDEPIFIVQREDTTIIVGERASINSFEITCPTQDYQYLLPFLGDLELDLNTAINPTDVVTMVIKNVRDEVIGYQDLDPDLIARFNGRKVSDWLFDYNHLEEPANFVLMASKPIAPVLAGNAFGKALARFAYRVPPGGANKVYIPHIPIDNQTWQTEVSVRSHNGGPNSSVILKDPQGLTISSTVVGTDATAVVEVSAGSGPWATITSDNPVATLSGFVVFAGRTVARAAAVPLVGEPSLNLTLPYLAGREIPGAWTGTVLVNPNPTETNVTILGYDSDGVISRNREEHIQPFGTLSLNVESWLDGIDPDDDTRWLVFVSDEPIIGTALFGNDLDERLSGVPMTSESGLSLVYTGIRANAEWSSRIVITNQDPTDAELRLIAIGGEAVELGELSLPIGLNQVRSFNVATAFASLGTAVAQIHTIRVVSKANLAGFCIRSSTDTPSQESYSALVEE